MPVLQMIEKTISHSHLARKTEITKKFYPQMLAQLKKHWCNRNNRNNKDKEDNIKLELNSFLLFYYSR